MFHLLCSDKQSSTSSHSLTRIPAQPPAAAYFCIPCEPPSGFPDNRENTGNFDHFGYFERRKAKEYEAITVTYERIPYRGEQGI
jgi:hypothetical protein